MDDATSSTRRAETLAELRRRLRGDGPRQWYFGSAFASVYQVLTMIEVWGNPGSLPNKVLATVAVVVVLAVFMAIPPLVWPQPVWQRLLAIGGFALLTIGLLAPGLGAYVIWMATLVVTLVAFSWIPVLPALASFAVILGAQALVCASLDWTGSLAYAVLVTAAVGSGLLAFAREIRGNERLRVANAELARLATIEERERLARDLHDGLGHSLTVVTVKAELAGRLLPRDPDAAAREIAEVEQLARQALHELRDTVRGVREPELDAELRAARVALSAAEIRAELPEDADAVDPELRTVFAWALREGVTNVLRHSGARSCRIRLDGDELRIRDDGDGAPRDAQGDGSGLRGLRERAARAGAELNAGNVEPHGFELVVRRPAR